MSALHTPPVDQLSTAIVVQSELTATQKKKLKKAAKKLLQEGGGVHGVHPTHTPTSTTSGENNNATKKKKNKSNNNANVPVRQLYPNGNFPVGEIVDHPLEINAYRKSSDQKQGEDVLFQSVLDEAREAALVHRTARKWFQSYVKPGMKMVDAAEALENKARELIGDNKTKAGIAFPLGCSVNNVAAHYTPNPGDNRVIGVDDVVKFDLGTHINGRIIDSAFTKIWNPKYQPLLAAVKAATNAGIAAAGIDVRICDIGEAIQEVMESHEIELDGVVYPIKCVRGLCGHSIERYNIHAGKTIPIVKGGPETKMEENEFFAIETFGTTGKGYMSEDDDCSHYMKDFHAQRTTLRSEPARKLLNAINDNFGTLAFCKRYLERAGQERYNMALRTLVQNGIVHPIPPLADVKGSFVAQFEHTLVLRPTCKEILSRGDDY
jgi:methionyl aminopeptidase